MALSNGRTVKEKPQGQVKEYPVLANAVLYHGGIGVINSDGRAKAGVTGTALIAVGKIRSNARLKGATNTKGSEVWDATGLANAAFDVEVEEGTFAWKNSGGDAILITQIGEVCYIEDDETVSATNGGGTQSAAGIVRDVDTDGVWVEMSLAISRELADSASWQASDADLTALAALAGTGLVAHTGVGTYAERTLTAPAAGITVTNPAGIAGNPTLVLANDLAGVEGLAAAGIACRTGADSWSVRTLTAPAAGITVSNGDGAAGNPTLALANDLAAYEGLGANGLVARTGDGTAAARTLTAPAAGISVANGDGVAGNPTLSLANDLAALEALAGTGFPAHTGADTWSERSMDDTSTVTWTNPAGVAGNPSAAVAPGSLLGTHAGNTGDDGLVGAIPVVFTFNISGGVTGNNDFVVTPKVEVVDMHIIKANAAGGAADTVQLLVGGNAITNALDVNVADKSIVRAGTIDDAFSTIAAGSTWRFTHTNGGGASDTTCIAVVTTLRRA